MLFVGGVLLLYLLLDSSKGTYIPRSYSRFHFFVHEKLLHNFCSVFEIIVMLETSFPVKPPETGSQLFIQYLALQIYIYSAVIFPTPLAHM